MVDEDGISLIRFKLSLDDVAAATCHIDVVSHADSLSERGAKVLSAVDSSQHADLSVVQQTGENPHVANKPR